MAGRLALIAAVVLSIAGCGLSFFGSLATPTGVTATTNRTELIKLSWTDVKGADVYYVYRSLSEDGPFRPDGPLVSIPYRTVRQTTLLDVDVDPTSYFYRVSAGRLSTGEESDMSIVAAGKRLAETIGWQDAVAIFGTAGTIRLALDRTTPTIQAYVLTVGNGTGASAAIRQIESDGTLTVLGGPSEATDGTDTRVADVVAAGNIYAAIVAESPQEPADTDKVFLYRYDSELEEWTQLAGSALDPAHPSAPFVTLVAIGPDDLLISYRGAGGEMVMYRYDGTLASLTAPSTTDDILAGGAGDAGPAIGQIDAAAVPGGAVLLYELEDDDVATPGDTISLQVAVWATGDWPAGSQVYDGTTGNVETGAAAITMDPAVAGVSIAYLDTTGIHIVDEVGAAIADSGPGFSGVVDTAGTSVGLAAQSGLISLFYLDLAKDAGVVAQYDTAALSWAQFSPADFTGSTPAALSLAAGGGKLFAAFDDNGITRIRAYQ